MTFPLLLSLLAWNTHYPHRSPYGSVDIHMNAHIPYPSKKEEDCTCETKTALPIFTRCKNPWAESASKYSSVYFSNSCFEVFEQLQKTVLTINEVWRLFQLCRRPVMYFQHTLMQTARYMCSVLMKTHLCTCCPDTVTEKLHTHSVEAATLHTSCEK